MKKNAFFFRGVVFGNPLFRVSKKIEEYFLRNAFFLSLSLTKKKSFEM